jgi:peptidoglycan hydrolase-like protein with peptidoglycan-binding domain
LPEPEQYTNRSWAAQVLKDMGAPETKNNVDNLTRWMDQENNAGVWTGVAGHNNPLNNGLGSGGGAGLGSYSDLTQAAKYAAQMLGDPKSSQKGSHISDIGDALKKDAPAAEFSQAVTGSKWAEGHYGVASAGAPAKYVTPGRQADYLANAHVPAEISANVSEHNVEQFHVRQAEVKEVQKALGLKVDGDPGKDTKTAIAKFQTEHGLKPTGLDDAATRAAMNVPEKRAQPHVTSIAGDKTPHWTPGDAAPGAPAAPAVTPPAAPGVTQQGPGKFTMPEVTIVGQVPKGPAAPDVPQSGQKEMDPRSIIIDGVTKGPNAPAVLNGAVKFMSFDAKTGMTTIDFEDKMKHDRSVSFKDPMGVGPDGEPIRHPLGEMVAKMEKNNERDTMFVVIDGKGNTDYAVGNRTEVDPGHSGPGAPKDLTSGDPRTPHVDKAALDAAIKDAVEHPPAEKRPAVSAWDR